MLYDLSNEFHKAQFLSRCHTLVAKGEIVELTAKAPRTRSQNSYLHLLIGIVAMETGNTLEDAKLHYFKDIVNADIFKREHRDRLGKVIVTYRSTSDLSREDMRIAIDRFKKWGAENSIYMPDPGHDSLLRTIEIEMGRQRAYLGE
mgnify:CR=1 FL=1